MQGKVSCLRKPHNTLTVLFPQTRLSPKITVFFVPATNTATQYLPFLYKET